MTGRGVATLRYLRKIRAVIRRKSQGQIGSRIGEPPRGPLAYLLEIEEVETGRVQTIHLDLSRSRDYYRLPVGRPLVLEIGRLGTRWGRWLHTWAVEDAANARTRANEPR